MSKGLVSSGALDCILSGVVIDFLECLKAIETLSPNGVIELDVIFLSCSVRWRFFQRLFKVSFQLLHFFQAGTQGILIESNICIGQLLGVLPIRYRFVELDSISPKRRVDAFNVFIVGLLLKAKYWFPVNGRREIHH